MDEIILDDFAVLGEERCGEGKYSLYVQYQNRENRYMLMFKSDDYDDLNRRAQRINVVRERTHQRRLSKNNIEAFVI